MLYEFILIEDIVTKKKHWYFKPRNLTHVLDFYLEYGARNVRDGVEFINKIEKDNGIHYAIDRLSHHDNAISQKIHMEAIFSQENTSYFERVEKTIRESLEGCINLWNRGYRFLLNKNLVSLIYTEDEIKKGYFGATKTRITNSLEFPKMIEEPRFLQFMLGKHWYVKVGNMDVVDEQGNQKWNTKEEAELAVENWLKQNK